MRRITLLVVLVLNPLLLAADDGASTSGNKSRSDAANTQQGYGQNGGRSFAEAAESVQRQLEEALAELNVLREQAASETVPLNKELSDLEAELVDVRREYQQTSRLLDSRTLDLSNLRAEIKSRHEEAAYLSNLLGEYIRNFESRLHIAELQRYRQALEAAKLAAENSTLSDQEVYEQQAELLGVSLDRLEEALGGTWFDGTAVDSNGTVKPGTFVLIGPVALFQSADKTSIGTVEQRLGSLEPAVVGFADPADAVAASKVISESKGFLPLDPTLGNAHKIEKTQETLLSHIQKGGPVMYPIFGLAGAALLVALFKWLSMAFLRTPSRKRIRQLLEAIAEHKSADTVLQRAKAVKGPVGKMLYAGAEHLKQPRELIEEVMYEKVLATRLKLERFLPFVAISAASAPLLGLLGTVTGIINTFKLITVFGSGDVKTLSGGISEALITTEFGLIVAIPSLLIHAFLSRKARGVVNQMEKAAVALVNQIGKTPYRRDNAKDRAVGQSAGAVGEASIASVKGYRPGSAGDVMDHKVVSLAQTATVGEAIDTIRASELDDDVDSVFVVNDQGKYVGHVPVRRLLSRPEKVVMESLAEKGALFVRVDTHQHEVQEFLKKNGLVSAAVLDQGDQLVGRITRRGNGDVNEG